MDDVRVVSLDLDDTLWDMWPVIRRAEEAQAQWLAARFPRAAERFPPPAMRALRPLMLERYPARRHDISFLRRATLAHCLEAAGYDPAAADEGFGVFLRERNRVELFDDVRPALEALAARFTLVAVSNGNADLDAIGIAGFFGHAVNAAQVGASKPSRAIFAAALARCGAQPEQVLHVGDDAAADVAGALDAGLHAAWLNRTGQAWPEPGVRRHHEVRTLTELVTLLDAA